ncbi:geranylgeranylglyceryl/heptaprenylglyceryl phosphate synthase [bacterium]|nr:geranylgeranylglyceryl/heptaprenylglyceryl phosphate synthase [bacterium]
MSNSLLKILNKDNFGFLALIDPDAKNDVILNQLIESINNSKFSAILVGGSSIEDDRYEQRLQQIKKSSNKPIILFPGSSKQISKNADAILFTSLLSGRNPKYLIEEQVKGAKLIKEYNLEVIPTGYLLLGSSKKTSVEKVSQTKPLDPLDYENVLHHCLAAQYFGMQFIYLENGSGSEVSIDFKLIKYLKSNLDIPIIVGGGIKKTSQIKEIKSAGADLIVIGTALEEKPISDCISKLLE